MACLLVYCVVLFFVKQKTAYESRISDGISDVCSPDLMERGVHSALGCITRELPTRPSNFRSVQTLPEWMAGQGVIGLAGIDTRALTRRIRDAGDRKSVV